MSLATQAHSVVAPTSLSRRIAGALVIAYALITMIPLSIAGFGNVTAAGDAVRVTSIDQHPTTLGHLGTSALIDRIEGRQKGRIHILGHVELAKGDTVAVIRD